ncbi:MAG: hypothetical protein IPN36_14995 [Bacteroidetes bacterium]|nr:hypothetical protein [Bacteroidota bacterium]
MIKEAFLVFALGALLYQISRLISIKVFAAEMGDILLSILILMTVKAYVFSDYSLLLSWVISKYQPLPPVLISGGIHLIIYDTFYCCSLYYRKSIPVLISQKQAEFYFVAETEQARV